MKKRTAKSRLSKEPFSKVSARGRKSHGGVGKVRIIGGQWRGRQLPVVATQGLRPSGDRTRETLFNWLQAYLPGSVCLDLFAGSGALGFEAASRQASFVALVEQDRSAAAGLRNNVELLYADQATADQVVVFCEDAMHALTKPCPPPLGRAYDVVFVDPPWASHWQQAVLQQLHENSKADAGDGELRIRLKPGALVYVESAREHVVEWPNSFDVLREKHFGEAQVQLLRWLGGERLS